MDDCPDGDKRIELLDSAVGNLFPPEEMCPALLVRKSPLRLQQLQEEYIQAGCTILIAPTSGLDKATLSRCGYGDEGGGLARKMVDLTRKTSQGRAKVAGSLGRLGLFSLLEQKATFEELVNIYKEQVQNNIQAGVDLFVIEGIWAIEEVRAALLAIKESCSLPAVVLMPFDEEGKTITGADVFSCLIILQDMGADVFGISEEIGPQEMARLLKRLAPYAKAKLAARPEVFWEAGEDDTDRRPMTTEEFAGWSGEIARLGITTFGGGRGASPKEIKAAGEQMRQAEINPPVAYSDPDEMVVATYGAVHFLTPAFDLTHTISCSAHMGEEIMDCEEEGASVIKVLVETSEDAEYLCENLYMIEMPLCVATHDITLLNMIARLYSGTLLFDNIEEIPKEQLQPLCKKYGMLVIGQ